MTFLPDADLNTEIQDISGKILSYGNPTLRAHWNSGPLTLESEEGYTEENRMKTSRRTLFLPDKIFGISTKEYKKSFKVFAMT